MADVAALGVPRRLCDPLRRWFHDAASVKAEDVLRSLPEPLAMMEVTGCSLADACNAIDIMSTGLCPPVRTAHALWEEQQTETSQVVRLQTGLRAIDEALGGRMEPGIIEAAGPSGVGKSQLAMTLCGCAAVHSASSRHPTTTTSTPTTSTTSSIGGVLYIDTEGKFVAQRLIDIVQRRAAQTAPSQEAAASLSEQALGCVVVQRASTLIEVADHIRAVVASSSAVPAGRGASVPSLVVIDSIAAPARASLASTDIRERQAILSEVAAGLKILAARHRATVFVTNQAAGKLSEEERGGLPRNSWRPALGPTWSHCVNTRLLLDMTDLRPLLSAGDDDTTAQATPSSSSVKAVSAALLADERVHAAHNGGIRSMIIAKSPYAPQVHDLFVIGPDGVSALPQGLRVARAAGEAAELTELAPVSMSRDDDDDEEDDDQAALAALRQAEEDEARQQQVPPEDVNDNDPFVGLTAEEMAALDAIAQD